MLHLSSAVVHSQSPEFNILAAHVRSGKLSLPTPSSLQQHQLQKGEPGKNLALVLASQVMLETLGFVYSKDAVLELSHLPARDISIVHMNLYSILTVAVGAHRVFAPMYPNFPEQVLAASDVELLINALMHYTGDWFGLRILPQYAADERTQLTLANMPAPTVLQVADRTATYDLLTRLVNSNASLSSDKLQLLEQLLAYFSATYPGRLLQVLSDATVPQKELRAFVGGWLVRNQGLQAFETVSFERLFKTPTDVLRLATAIGARELTDADLSLSQAPRFKAISRPIRMFLLRLLNDIKTDTVREEMFSRREMWLRLGETLHPQEHKKWFKRANKHFEALRANAAPISFAGTVESAVAQQDFLSAVALLSQRPGVFARKLHEVLRKAPDALKAFVTEAFVQVAHKVSTPVLLQVRQRMAVQYEGITARGFIPKAGAGRMWVPVKATPDPAFALIEPFRAEINVQAGVIYTAVNDVLTARFAQLPKLGAVYIAPSVYSQTVAFGQRTAQKALRTVGRGSRIALGDERIMRVFLWWNESGIDKQGNAYTIGRTDLDLSCAVYDSNMNYLTHCSFTNLREQGLTHSGDITSAPAGACEFIDIDFDELPPDAAYIGLIVFAYTQQNFADMPEAYMGWMARTDGQSGEIYEASTVRQKVDLAAAGSRLLSGFIDVQSREFVWADLVLPAQCHGFNAVETATIMMKTLAPGVLQPIRPHLGELLADHASARGHLVSSPEKADIIFTTDLSLKVESHQRLVSAYDAELIAAEFLK